MTSTDAIQVTAPISSDIAGMLTPAALTFVTELHQRFDSRRRELLQAREERQARLDAGEQPDFLSQTSAIREQAWQVAPPRPDLTDRRVEITGPVNRKMMINALNSGARVFMADFEDANSPTWENVMHGQINLHDAVRRTIQYISPEGKTYRLQEQTATLVVRPRGWHLPERHMLVEGTPIAGAFLDFGLYFFHNAAELVARGSGPYFYLPKLESHLEARLWNDIFLFAQTYIGLPRGTIRATVLIETVLAAFEIEEILYELREHSAGLNCGRWDYIFSAIKKFRSRPEFVLPDRAKVTMTTHMMHSYSLLAIQTAHRRGAHAIGGMSAFIPIKNDEAANERAFAQVRLDKEREASDGHDGTWVAHPGMVALATEVFDRLMVGENQLGVLPAVQISAHDLLTVPKDSITETGLRTNVSVSVQYLAAWLQGSGAVPINNLMEDAATAEISRAQVWQWLHHHARLEDGREVTMPLVGALLDEEVDRLGRAEFGRAATLFWEVATSEPLTEFLTLTGYRELTA